MTFVASLQTFDDLGFGPAGLTDSDQLQLSLVVGVFKSGPLFSLSEKRPGGNFQRVRRLPDDDSRFYAEVIAHVAPLVGWGD